MNLLNSDSESSGDENSDNDLEDLMKDESSRSSASSPIGSISSSEQGGSPQETLCDQTESLGLDISDEGSSSEDEADPTVSIEDTVEEEDTSCIMSSTADSDICNSVISPDMSDNIIILSETDDDDVVCVGETKAPIDDSNDDLIVVKVTHNSPRSKTNSSTPKNPSFCDTSSNLNTDKDDVFNFILSYPRKDAKDDDTVSSGLGCLGVDSLPQTSHMTISSSDSDLNSSLPIIPFDSIFSSSTSDSNTFDGAGIAAPSASISLPSPLSTSSPYSSSTHRQSCLSRSPPSKLTLGRPSMDHADLDHHSITADPTLLGFDIPCASSLTPKRHGSVDQTDNTVTSDQDQDSAPKNNKLVIRKTFSAPNGTSWEVSPVKVEKPESSTGGKHKLNGKSDNKAISIPIKKRKVFSLSDASSLSSTTAASASQSADADGSIEDNELSYFEDSSMPNVQYICIRCHEYTGEWKVAFCEYRHPCCKTCIEKEVSRFLSTSKKGMVKCILPTCNKEYTITQLQPLLPPMVVDIIEQKEASEAIHNITEWMRHDTLFSEYFHEDETPEQRSERQQKEMARRVFAPPDNWDPMPDSLKYKTIILSAETREYQMVANDFHRTMTAPRAHIVQIKRVQNQDLWRLFSLKKMQMDREYKDDCSVTVEMELFHGTSNSCVDAIIESNFDWRLSGVHATMYGCGSYFARDASYSHSYTDMHPEHPRNSRIHRAAAGSFNMMNAFLTNTMSISTPSPVVNMNIANAMHNPPMPPFLGHANPIPIQLTPTAPSSSSSSSSSSNTKPHIHTVFRAKVLVGKYTQGKQSDKRPPPIDPKCRFGKCFDACVNRMFNPQIFVIFDSTQCYPEYVIEYTNRLLDTY